MIIELGGYMEIAASAGMEGREVPKISTGILNKILWRNFFKVVKRTWGVFGNYILHTVGVRMGKLIVVEIKKQLKEERLEHILKTLLEIKFII